MSNPTEYFVREHVVDGVRVTITKQVWPRGEGLSFEVYRGDETGELLTMAESFDEDPDDDSIRFLLPCLRCDTCGEHVISEVASALREHLAVHHGGAYALDAEEVRDCFSS